jgi:hypothetical protein
VTEQAEAVPAPKPRFPRWRRITSWIALLLAAFLVPLSVLAIFVRNEVLDTGQFVTTMAPLARNPDVQQAAATRITNTLMEQVDVESLAKDALPPRASFLAGPLSTGVQTFVQTTTEKILASQQFQTFWDQATRLAHAQVVRLLTGNNNGNVQVVNGEVQLDLGPLVNQVKTKLVDSGLSFLKNVDTSRINTKLTLFQAKNLETARQGTKALKALAFVLPILIVGLFTASVLLAHNRRRAILRSGIALAIAAAFLSVTIAISRTIYLDAVSSFVISKDAASAVYDTVIRDIKRADRALILLGLLIALGAWIAGPSRGAVWVRNLFTRGATEAGEHVGENKVNTWVAHHLALLRTLIILVAVLALVIWDQPGPLAVFLMALFVVLAFALVEVMGRAGKPRVEAGEAPT